MTRPESIYTKYGDVHWWPDDDKRSHAFVCSVHVDEHHRGQGLGTQLMLELASELVKRRFWTVELDNCSDPGSQFYERLGFTYKDKHDNAMTVKTLDLFQNCCKLLSLNTKHVPCVLKEAVTK
jgi:ribosomal protein S18 acetylase RimI-like enzyme